MRTKTGNSRRAGGGMIISKKILMAVALMTALSVSPINAAEEASGEDEGVMAMVQPYLDQVRPYLAPVETFMRAQADSFKGFIKDNFASGGTNRDTPKVVIDLPPNPSPK